MSKHSTNVGEYKEMYLINKFQKDIMENSLGNMSSEKIKSKENYIKYDFTNDAN